ncbi:hypothetical protein [Streptomyces sp. PBH53]|uniref:hypothetical protein n=1 Tax=Streptomyces sp. PBH53 TaxID=1577075 RepID=UPI000A85AD45|nr:hypothetical protein [Streptomyces sp. PBH53]
MTDAHGDEAPTDEPAGGSFAERLDFLCRHDPRGPFSSPRVVRMLADQGMPAPSDTYIWQLRTGRADNPTKKHMDALADLFGVPRDYWSNDATAAVMNGMIHSLNKLKAKGATGEQLHRQLVRFTKRMKDGVPPESLIEQLHTVARLSEAGVTATAMKRLQDARVTRIAMRAADLSDKSLTAAAAMIEHFRQLEGLPPEPPSQSHT